MYCSTLLLILVNTTTIPLEEFLFILEILCLSVCLSVCVSAFCVRPCSCEAETRRKKPYAGAGLFWGEARIRQKRPYYRRSSVSVFIVKSLRPSLEKIPSAFHFEVQNGNSMEFHQCNSPVRVRLETPLVIL